MLQAFCPALLRVLTIFVSFRKEVTCKNRIFGPSQTKRFLVRATALIVKDNRLLVVEDEDGFIQSEVLFKWMKLLEMP